jgi:hypothetical protein
LKIDCGFTEEIPDTPDNHKGERKANEGVEPILATPDNREEQEHECGNDSEHQLGG